MSINKNELFKSKKIWPLNIIFPKKLAFKRLGVKKLGVLGIIFLFGTATFISGFSINSYAASSSTVLPISRGGTDANTAAQASSNILGANFANYNGVLPAVKGGTGTGEATAGNSTKLSANLAINPKYQYPYTLHGDNAFFLVLRVALTTTTSTGTNAVYSQALRITGIKHLHSSEPEMQQWVLVYNPKNASLDFSKSFYLYGYHASCKSNLSPAYAVLDKDAGVLTAWFYRPAYYNEPHIEWFYGYSSSWMWNGFTNYAKAIAVSNTNDRPEEALNIYPHCAAYTLPSPSPTPTPTPTETP